jgi:hypothetical protein
MHMRHRLLVPATLLAVSALLWLVASNFRRGVGQYDVLGPSFFPKLILFGLAVVSLCDLVLSARQRVHAAAGGVVAESRDGKVVDHGLRERGSFCWTDLLLAAGITIGYVLLLPHLGFLVGTLLFQFALLFGVFRERRASVVLGGPFALTLLFLLIFGIGMDIALPHGRGIFLGLSRFLY